MLHIFIHFYIGHLEEEYGNDDYTKFKSMMIAEVVLTFCLAGLIYLEGEISTILAIAIGNRLYEQSFEELGKKRLSWYGRELSVKLADKYNHVELLILRTTKKCSSPATPSWASTKT